MSEPIFHLIRYAYRDCSYETFCDLATCLGEKDIVVINLPIEGLNLCSTCAAGYEQKVTHDAYEIAGGSQ